MGAHHARLLADIEGVELVGVVDRAGDPGRLLPPSMVYRSIDELLALEIEMCVVATPTADHLRAGLRLAAAGVATLIEKPLARTVAECGRLVAAFDEAGVFGGTGFVERFNPAVVALKHMLNRGDIGEPQCIATNRQGPLVDRVSDVGVTQDLVSHDVDLTRWIFESTYRSVSAQRVLRPDRGHEDRVVAVGQLANGVVVRHVASRLTSTRCRRITVTGEWGTLVADTLTSTLTLDTHGTRSVGSGRPLADESHCDRRLMEIEDREPLRRELEHFRDAVGGNRSDLATLMDGLAAAEVVETILASAAI